MNCTPRPQRYIVAFVGERWFSQCTCGWESRACLSREQAVNIGSCHIILQPRKEVTA